MSRRRPRAALRETFDPLPVERLVEIVWELGDDFDGTFDVDDDVAGARVKPVVYVPEGKLDLVDRAALREVLLGLGATYVKAPVVHVMKRKTRRDERHDVELSLEESLGLFADETKIRDAAAKIAFAAELAREADAGVTE